MFKSAVRSTLLYLMSRTFLQSWREVVSGMSGPSALRVTPCHLEHPLWEAEPRDHEDPECLSDRVQLLSEAFPPKRSPISWGSLRAVKMLKRTVRLSPCQRTRHRQVYGSRRRKSFLQQEMQESNQVLHNDEAQLGGRGAPSIREHAPQEEWEKSLCFIKLLG